MNRTPSYLSIYLRRAALVMALVFTICRQSLSGIPADSTNQIFINPLSVQSLYLETVIRDSLLVGTATGFVILHQGKYFLITNWHVVSGKDPRTLKPLHPAGVIPEQIIVWHNAEKLGTWIARRERLYDSSGKPRWYEHPYGKKVDVVALPLDSIGKPVTIYPFDLGLGNTDMIPEVAMPVSILGFPLGLSGPGKLTIWKTGHIASEPNVDYDSQPAFMIDATTRGGMSGSPVILRLWGGYRTSRGDQIMSQSAASTRFLGVYSGQWEPHEIGLVWRPEVITEILKGVQK